jgi:beta-aspartyl-peptidase (threonine type)
MNLTRTPPNFSIAVHGGAGTVIQGQADEAPYHAALARALEAGAALLRRGGSALDAVQAACQSLEDCPLFNAGLGSVYTRDARHEMDAGLMDGRHLQAGAVACVSQVKNPVALARHVLDDGQCVLLVGDGAQRFADECGLPRMDAAYFGSAERLAQLRRLQAQSGQAALLDHDASDLAARPAPLHENGKMGTVGAVARDVHGNLAAAASTGGLTNKRAGRVGDTPVVGAGFYADNTTCAVAATGTGEHFLRAALAHDIHARMRYLGQSLEQAAHAAVQGTLTDIGGKGGVVAVDGQGRVYCPFNSAGMYRGYIVDDASPVTRIFG